MFGKNTVRKVRLAQTGSSLDVIEIFSTIQGEGPYSGMPATFIRLAGCSLRCTYCDTQFEDGAHLMTLDEIEAAIDLAGSLGDLVVITGGEPLLQNLGPLIDRLYNNGNEVQIETSGSVLHPEVIPFLPKITVVCSPKTPDIDPKIAEWCMDFKYVIRAGEVAGDGLPNTNPQRPGKEMRVYRTPDPLDTIWVSPCDDHDPEKNAANLKEATRICMDHGYRLNLQIHKLINLP